MEDVVLFVDDLQSIYSVSYCRICHEAEIESCKSLETPCACSGTVKFAHRDCIQRWCDEKGNTTCEICLQNYEPGYTATTRKCQLIEEMTIRDSLEIPRIEHETEDQELAAANQEETTDSPSLECASAADRSGSLFRSLAVMFTVLMLLKHLFATLAIGTEDYPFTLLTILILRVSGILLPMYIVFRAIAAIEKRMRQQHQESDDESNGSDCEGDEEDLQDLV